MSDFLKQLSLIRELSESSDSRLIELEIKAKAENVPIIKPETARFLEIICMLKKPKNILEIGTAIGYSSIVMANVVDKNSFIDTIEINKNRAEQARENIKNLGYEKKIRVIYGDAIDVLKCVDKKYQLIFMDAAKGQYIEFLPECVRLLDDDGVLITDNVFCQGFVFSQKVVRRKRTMVRKVEEYIDTIMSHEIKTALISMGDGISISVKTNS